MLGDLEPGEYPKEGRLARSRWSKERHELTVPHRQGDVVEGRICRIALRDVLDANGHVSDER
jgi:hypothetical protein